MTPRLISVASALLLGISLLGLAAVVQGQEGPKPGQKPAATDKKPAADKAKKAGEKTTTVKEDEKEKPAPARTTVAGHWFLVITQGASDLTLGLIEIKEADGKFTATVAAAGEQLPDIEIKSFSVKDKSVDLTLANPELRFAGTLRDGTLKGELHIGTRGVVPAWLDPTDDKNLKNRRRPVPAEGRETLAKAFNDETFAALDEWTRKNPNAPAASMAYQQALSLIDGDVKAADAETFAKRYVDFAGQWGPSLVAQAHSQLGEAFAKDEDLHELALTHLDAVEKSSASESIKSSALTTKAKLLLSSGKEAEGLALAEKVVAKNPYEAELALLLARDAESKKETDKAIEQYARIVATPLMERQSGGRGKQAPSAALGRLWQEKHGSDKGLDEFLNEAYEKAILVMKPERAPARKAGDGNRVALFELFTGQACPPCVAADVATGLLEHAYAPTEVIVLRYHENIPAGDPLANRETLERFQAYEGQGTPTLIANGKPLSAGGYMEHVKDLFEQLREAAAETLTEKTEVALDVSARADGRKISIAARANGLKDAGRKVKLRLALAEEKVPYKARNGIRSHEMVVRSMPGGAKGVTAKDGKLEFTGDVDLDDLQTSLAEDIAGTEEQMEEEFEAKPLELQKFRLVAFVQDDSTGEVLQAKSVEVEGKIAPGKPPVKKEKKSEEDDEPKPSKGKK